MLRFVCVLLVGCGGGGGPFGGGSNCAPDPECTIAEPLREGLYQSGCFGGSRCVELDLEVTDDAVIVLYEDEDGTVFEVRYPR